MTVGLQIWNSAGTLVFDTNTADVGQLVELVTATTSTQTFSYPVFAGKTAEVVVIYGGATLPSISYSSGYPVISFPAYATTGATLFAIIIS
jgi:hypothetical protein